MLKKIVLSVGGATCLIAGVFVINANNSAAYAAADCLAGPNRASGPGTHWHYRINQTTHQRCWYLKRVGGHSRPRPSGETRTRRSHEARATPSSASASSEARARPDEVASAAPAETKSSIKAWFTATFSALSGAATSGAKPVTTEPVTSEPAPRKRRNNDAERTEPAKSERSEKTKTARVQQRSSSSAEAASYKAAAEAAGDKDVTPPPSTSDEPEWQKALYEEFLQWRVKQLLFE